MKYDSENRKRLSRCLKAARKIIDEETQFSVLEEKDFKNETLRLKRMLSQGKTLDDIMIPAYALVREAAFRTLGMQAFEVQLAGAAAMHKGCAVQMNTGEGKTLAAVFPAYLHALEGKGAFIATVNDYLAERDSSRMKPVFNLLGLTCSAVRTDTTLPDRKKAYQADVTYGTGQTFGFDYLRDNTALSPALQVQRGLHYAVIDEADSILIDEAGTPLILSKTEGSPVRRIRSADRFVRTLDEDDFEIDLEYRTAVFTDKGIRKAEEFCRIERITDPENILLYHTLLKALEAHKLFQCGRDYLVQENEIVIIDDFTGRILSGRRYSDGLHQAVEAKEGVRIKGQSRTAASTTFQSFFRLFDGICGMSGTLCGIEDELYEVYGLKTLTIPPNRKCIRQDMPDRIFSCRQEKYEALFKEVLSVCRTGRPLLIGTQSVEESEFISSSLNYFGVRHALLHAGCPEKEAQIIAGAGQIGAVTVSTNMAGRGTDIKLGPGAAGLGGLYVIGTGRSESERVDRQLKGRSGRQGDPGKSQLFLSLDDDILNRFYPEKAEKHRKRYSERPGEIFHPIVRELFEKAQKTAESRSAQSRMKKLLYEEVIGQIREVVYQDRQCILNGLNIEKILAGEAADEQTVLQDHMLPEELNRRRKILGDSNFGLLCRKVFLKTLDELWQGYIEETDRLRTGIGLRSLAGQDPLQMYIFETHKLYQCFLQELYPQTILNILNTPVFQPAS